MPTAVEKRYNIEVSSERRDSTFTYDHSAAEEMDGLRGTATLSRSSEHFRHESVDSGIGGMAAHATDINLAMKRCESDLTHSMSNQAENNSQMSSINEQTLLLLRKMQILDMKLQSMETQLKNEQRQRLVLEAKVVKLEKDNEQLKSVRVQAGKQLQGFAEIFYAETESIKLRGSCNPSPHPSLAELRRSRTDSLSSSSSGNSRGSRISN